MPLTVENIISRIHLPANVPDVVPSIVMDFLVPDISLARAIDVSSSVALLDFIWARSVRDARSDRWSVARLLQSQPRYFRWEFSQALLQAVSCEDRGMVEWVVAHFPGCPVSGRVLEEVAARGWLWLLQLLQAQEGGALRCSKETLSKAAENGHWEVVHWLIDHTNTVQDNHRYLVGIAVGANNLEEYRWLKARGYGVDRVAFTESPQEEWPVRKEIFYDVLQRSRWMAGSALRDAARNDDVPFAEWLVTHYCKDGGTNLPHYSGAKAASEKGCLEMLQWHLKRLRDVIDLSEVMFLAAENGRLEVVKWLRTEYATKPSVDLFQGTSSHFGASACAFAMDAAAGQGHLDVLQFLHELCISLQTQRKAEHPGSFQHDAHIPHFGPQCSPAKCGHLEIVKWLFASRSEDSALANAGITRHLRLEPRCRKKQIISAMRQAVEHDHFEVVLFLHTMYVKCRDANKMQAELKRNLFWVRNDDEIRAWIEEH
ncbi:hypothetical protein PHYPSEUDO_015230 [Phytophthora pseudosyringae]|uniref:Ankyrin repeat-containing domain n=1 Tax=Phytophthora pseudosyringae TaxID=221518 RepID=A0A8T1VZ93_9STRA|nr:hypothetical protein PHYPSEUDO_015230 [Phytophthora pseudosyringae]